ncbi:hypothetical protein [Pendulispora albinea]|uniref:Tetratricopeptide repeat protein n=1 Tax=Pendulispora albinea TaxID=2741071 RepID=A0ABZ2LTI5_9BACT
MRSFLAAVAVAVCLTTGAIARADEQSELDKGRNAYLARQYDEADARFRAMLSPSTGTLRDPTLVTQAYMYWGAVKIARSRPAEASSLFEQLLLKNPQYEPDPLSFPTSVLDAFSDTRSRIRERLNAQAREAARREAERRVREEEERKKQLERIRVLERMASEEKIEVYHSRILAFVPFGAGQFQNGSTGLGWFFLGAESLCLAVGTLAIPFYYSEKSAFVDAYNDPEGTNQTSDAQRHYDRARTWGFINMAAYSAFLVTAAAGIVEANVAFRSHLTIVKKRPIPPAVSFAPTLTQGGAGMGLRLTF